MAANQVGDHDDELKNSEKIFVDFWTNELTNKPRCIVFDMDYTLWPFFVDQHLSPPFSTQSSSKTKTTLVYDHRRRLVEPYPEVNAILALLGRLKAQGLLQLAIASRSSRPGDSAKVMELLGWTPYFDSVQIYPTGKQKHLTEIKNELALASFQEMLFFDDTLSSIKAASQLDVVAHKLNRTDGLTFRELASGLRLYAKCR